jgi:hypothetical protein
MIGDGARRGSHGDAEARRVWGGDGARGWPRHDADDHEKGDGVVEFG